MFPLKVNNVESRNKISAKITSSEEGTGNFWASTLMLGSLSSLDKLLRDI